MSFKTVVEQIKASQQSALDLNSQLFNQQLELQKREFDFKGASLWGQQIRSLGAEYISSLTEFLYESKNFENQYLAATRQQKMTRINQAGLAYHQLVELNKKCFLKAVEIDLYFEPNNKEYEDIIYFIDLATDTMNAIIHEYLQINSKNELKIIVPNKEKIIKIIDDKFTKEELNLIDGAFKIVYLSILMRKINSEIKNVANKKAA